MTSKEALEYVTSDIFTGGNSILKEEAEVCKNIILQDLDRLEELEKGNQEWIKLYNLITEGNWNLKNENQKLKKAIEQAIELLSVDGKGTKQEVKKLLSEVLDNEI